MRNAQSFFSVLILLALLAPLAWSTETEHLGVRIVPSPGKVQVDGQVDDWDLSGGIFVCSDVENQRAEFSTWVSLMYDADNLYVLSRWNDKTPLNNSGSSAGDAGFAGDALQFRTITGVGTAERERTAHFTCWRDREAVDVIDIAYGKKFNEGKIPNATREGARQAMAVNADGSGYVQEIGIPWKLLTHDGKAPAVTEKITITFEPNFTIGKTGRYTIKDNFKPGVTPNRVFTFMSSPSWGPAAFVDKGPVDPQPVRLADGREFAVRMENRLPMVDWSGLIKSAEPTGFKTIKLDVPADGYVSLNIVDSGGAVVRQLLSSAFYTKGLHEVKWDGLTTTNWRTPGDPVAAGEYTWQAIWHPGIGLKLRGWASNGGRAPWDSSPPANWGGDHGAPSAVVAIGKQIILGWTAAEAGKALLGCDLEGNVRWHVTRGGIGGATEVAVDRGTVYAVNGKRGLYRVDLKTGGYTVWAGSDTTDLKFNTVLADGTTDPGPPAGLAATGGKLVLSYPARNQLIVLDGASGKHIKALEAPSPGATVPAEEGCVLVISGGTDVLKINLDTGAVTKLLSSLQNARGIATDEAGQIYVAVGEPDNQVIVFDAKGVEKSRIGRAGGRAALGAWQRDGMRFVKSIAVDVNGRLWAMEADTSPKRVSVWDARTGEFVKEFFGPTGYGALGGAINPQDPNLMVGEGCEWRLDPKTGRADCVGVITKDGMANSRFAVGSNGRLYLAVASQWAHARGTLSIYERLGDANYKLRTVFSTIEETPPQNPKSKTKPQPVRRTVIWTDENDDGERQPNESRELPGEFRFSGWFMNLSPDLSLYAANKQFKVTGFTACGAPKYDLNNPIAMPAIGLGSADGRLVMSNGRNGEESAWFRCFDIASGKQLWAYPDNFVGVHGSHSAPPQQVGLIRGSFGPCGVVRLPDPIGNVWVIPTNVGEWHVLTEKGFYLTRLFQGDPMRVRFPESAEPGADMTNTPPGMGGEDFGGSVTAGVDGKMYVQAGKTAYWNLEVVGLDQVRTLSGGRIAFSDSDTKLAAAERETKLQLSRENSRLTVTRGTPTLTGALDKDFGKESVVAFQKADDAKVRAAIAWDDTTLYIGWDVSDNTPWTNAAGAVEDMYIGGDTVDFQFATDPSANRKRTEAVLGDARLSIGNFKNTPTAVLYRKVSTEKKPHTFRSGIVESYPMDFVGVLKDAKITVKKRSNGYVVEAAISLASLNLRPKSGTSLLGDIGVTHGDPAGQRTRLRTYWSNQQTGIVDDAVFELKMEPKNWGELFFGE